MKKQTLVVAALALGTTLASVPAMAQHYGLNPNDGGQVQVQGDYYPPQTSTTQHSSAAPYYGKAVNDGGMVPEPPAQHLYNTVPDKTPKTPPHYGRAANDGGN